MRHFRFPLIALVALLAAVLACGQSPAKEPTVRVRPTLRPTYTLTPLPATDTPLPPTRPPTAPVPPTDTPLPTATSVPPTATPVQATDTPVPPTATPQPTPKPAQATKAPPAPTVTPNLMLLSDNFNGGLGGGWKPFLNYWRVKADQWYWSADGGVDGSGAMVHSCCINGGQAEDALMVYLGEGAESWTDYRVQVQLLVPTEKGQWQGLWVRGQYEERTRKDTAQWVTGYYVLLGHQRTVRLLQLQTAEDCREAACRNPENQYAFNNPYLIREEQVAGVELARGVWHTLAVEVRGSQIKIWVDGVFAFEHVDDTSPFLQGTVGFKTYEADPVFYDNLVVTPLR